ncbi:hypothetical protein CKAN_00674100 [Cinnamomum micranthum f. kanehirae]|uniref:Uncharacterized protein n=1 Tax=Cinnamomum micranthum f. kanehirae TaxID=337451 RepID=A0A443NI65_9MAGN|nr:hypothetical protein CKAN_00674100 [Cinnamomum micranthum f. kanehirae]
MRKAADIVWLGIDTNNRWLGKDLKKLALAKSADRILEELARSMENYVLGYTTSREKEKYPRDWRAKHQPFKYPELIYTPTRLGQENLVLLVIWDASKFTHGMHTARAAYLDKAET